MTDHDAPAPAPIAPAAPEMAERLATNRTGRLTPAQRRTVLGAGVFALGFLLCPLALVVQMIAILSLEGSVEVTVSGIFFTVLGALFAVLFAGLIGSNAVRFLPEALGRQPVRYARGPLRIHLSEGERPELPFSYVVDDYSFAPYVVPPDLDMRSGAPYLVYYSRRSRLLLSITALDAPDAEQWEPHFENPPPYDWH